MPYLTHADAKAAKAAEAEAAARSKIAVTAPARKPVIAATAPVRNGEAERIDMCAEEEREEEEERNTETILCTSARFKFLLLARLRRGPRARVGGTVAAVRGGLAQPAPIAGNASRTRRFFQRSGPPAKSVALCSSQGVRSMPFLNERRAVLRLHDRLADLRDDLRDIDDGKHADELDERLCLIPHDRILHHRPSQRHLARQSRRCCNGKQPGPGELSPKEAVFQADFGIAHTEAETETFLQTLIWDYVNLIMLRGSNIVAGLLRSSRTFAPSNPAKEGPRQGVILKRTFCPSAILPKKASGKGVIL
ncbi:hypothetical protein T492DRAFT_1139881 [Pavlovales sp. CCMP2436]|nr:hypothetical protein T492DRAFT_1139881 [Pavlovales sp. CCMP2436]